MSNRGGGPCGGRGNHHRRAQPPSPAKVRHGPTPVRHPRPPGAAGAVKKTEPAMSRSHPPVSIIGAPTDIGAGTRGARMGPEALRVAGLVEALAARGIDVIDRGNVEGPRDRKSTRLNSSH